MKYNILKTLFNKTTVKKLIHTIKNFNKFQNTKIKIFLKYLNTKKPQFV